MQPTDRKKFLEIVVGFAELKGKALSAPALELYWNSMQGWSIEDFSQAAQHLVRSCEFMPTPKDFEDLKRAGNPTAAEAWAAARKALQWTVNGYVEKPGTDPLVSQALRSIGGANALAMCETGKLHFLERRFCEHYEALQDAAEVRDAVPQIAGPDSVPRLIGERMPGLRRIVDDMQRPDDAYDA